MEHIKTEKEVLAQYYMSADDLKVLLPTMGLDSRRKFINDIRDEMKRKKFFVPTGKTKLAITKLVRNRLGI